MKNNAGYSLLEVVVSLAVSAIVLGGLYLVFQTGARLNARADQNLEEQQLVQNAAEYLLAYGYDPDVSIPGVSENVKVEPHDVDAEKGYCSVMVSSLENPDIKLSFDVCIAPTPSPVPSEDEGTGG